MASTVAYFEQIATQWSDCYTASSCFQQRLATVLSWLPGTRQPAQVLDYGCGSGVFVKALADRGYHVTGVDESPAMIEAARRTLAADPTASDVCRLERVDSESFGGEFLNERFDCVLCLGVLEYVDRYQELLARLCSVLKPGGSLILSVPNKLSLTRKLESLIYRFPWPFKKAGLFPYLTADDSYLRYQVHQFSGPQLNREMARHGATFEQGLYHVLLGSRAESPLARRLVHHPLFGMTLIARYRKQSKAA